MLDLYSFTNESAVEHSFAAGVQQTQYRVLTHEQYAKHKVGSAESLTLKCCKTPFYYPKKEQCQYQHPLRVQIAAEDVFKAQASFLKKDKPLKDPRVSTEKENDMKNLTEISAAFKPQTAPVYIYNCIYSTRLNKLR